MTVPEDLRINVGANFPTRVLGQDSINVSKANGIYTIKSNYPALGQLAPPIANPSQKLLKLYDPTSGAYSTVPVTGLPYMSGREVLTANRTYFVRTDGNDNNTGLVNSAAGAFLTIQKAITACWSLDLNGFLVIIQVGNGTYTSGVNVNKPFVGGQVTLRGDIVTPSNVVISTAASCVSVSGAAQLNVQGFKFISSAAHGIASSSFGLLAVNGPVEFGTCAGRHIDCEGQGNIAVLTNYTISGGAAMHLLSVGFAYISMPSRTITLTGTPAFTIFALCQYNSGIDIYACTFVGGATGQRFSVSLLSYIRTDGGGANYLPGNSAGAVDAATFGVYT